MADYENEAEAPVEKKGVDKMSEDELEKIVSALIEDAAAFVDGELSRDRAIATDYYAGEPYGNEQDGRSQVVTTEVRDNTLATMPSILRVVFGPERAVEFAPRNQNQVKQAAQASDFAQFVLAEDNPGFLIMHGVLKDGLVRRMGIVKWWYDDNTETKGYKINGIPESQLIQLLQEPGVELQRAVERSAPSGLVAPDGSALSSQPAEKIYDVEITHSDPDGRVVIEGVPPEELLYNREARSKDSALGIWHRTEKTLGELVAMGYDEDEIEKYAKSDATALKSNPEAIARRRVTGESGQSEDPEAGEANKKILYVEGHVRIDFDGDGIAELRKVCTVGDAFHVVMNEPTDGVNMAIFCPDPEPHTMSGQSLADRTMDLQLLKSTLLRAGLDSLAASIFPRTEYVEGEVSVADILNTEIGAPIRVTRPGMIREASHTFVGGEVFPFLQYVDEINERRTGQNKGTNALDADALQSTSANGIQAVVSASQEQKEMLVRIFCETLLKPMFRGIHKLLVENKPKSRMVRLRNEWVDVDPRVWDANMDVVVNVALGSGLVEQKVATLMGVAAKQELIIQTLGPDNPVCKIGQYANTLRRIVELQGFKDTSSFFNAVDTNWAPQPQPPAPDPKMQIEQMKQANAMQMKQIELQAQERVEMFNAQMTQQIEKMKLEQAAAIADRDYNLKLLEIASKRETAIAVAEAQYKTTIDSQTIDAQVTLDAEHLKAEAENLRTAATISHEAKQAVLEASLEHRKIDAEEHRTEVQATQTSAAPASENKSESAPAAPAQIHVHTGEHTGKKMGKLKVNRGQDGRIESIEEEGGDKPTGSKKEKE